MLVVAACLLLTSFLRLRDADPGFQADGVLRVRVDADRPVWPLVREAMGRLAALPGVTAVGAASTLPLTGFPGHDHCAQPGPGRPVPVRAHRRRRPVALLDADGRRGRLLSARSASPCSGAGHSRAGDADEAAETGGRRQPCLRRSLLAR